MGFNIHVFNGENPQEQYNAITHDPNTLYLLASGKGYLGDDMLFNADTNIDFSDIQQVKDKLTYTEHNEEGNETVFSSIISNVNTKNAANLNLQPMLLNPEDKGLSILTDETNAVLFPEQASDFDTFFEEVLENGTYSDTAYQDRNYLLNMVPTMHCMMKFVTEYMEKRLKNYVQATVDNGTNQ